MKNIFLINVILCSFFYSCSLKEEVYDSITTETFFRTEADADAAINGAYNDFSTYGMYKDQLTCFLMLSSDGALRTGTSGERADFTRKTFQASNAHITNIWEGWYNTINNANNVLYYVPKIVMNEDKKKRILGEAHFILGYCYFNIGRMFGKGIIKDRPTLTEEDFNKPLSSLDKVYEEALKHLLLAEEMCVEKNMQPISELGRATKGAAQATLADLYLTMRNWEKAEFYADAIINSNQYSLVPDFATLWNVELEAVAEKTEVIFAIQFKRDPNRSGSTAKGNAFTFRTTPRWRGQSSGDADNGRGGEDIKMQQWFYDECSKGDYVNDYRTKVSFQSSYIRYDNGQLLKIYPDVTTSTSYPYCAKYYDPKGLDNNNQENDMYIYRLAEIYLIKAEAANEQGKASEAYIAFNKIRERARNANGIPRTTPLNLVAGLSIDDFRHAVFKERGFELSFELKRWFDLKRMKRADGQDYFDYMYKVYIPTLPTAKKFLPSLVYAPHTKLLPIPTIEINRNKNISNADQNPGY